MTICIAALAENGKKVILAADQMITANLPMGCEFETDDVKKIFEIHDKVSVLTAGDALISCEIVEKAQKSISLEMEKTGGKINIERMATILSREYAMVRMEKACTAFLTVRGLTWDIYVKTQRDMNQAIVNGIENSLQTYNIGVTLIIAGIDPIDNRGAIYTILNPGGMSNNNAIAFNCAGSGAAYATLSFISSKYKRTLSFEEVKDIVSEAKEKSQIAPGVGKETTSVFY